MMRGLRLEQNDVSYLKEGFKLLSLCEGYEEIVRCFEDAEGPVTTINRLKFNYISAKYHLGQYAQALGLLERDGGLEIEDIREGEDSVEQLWTQMNDAVGNEKRDVPYRYLFKAF